MRNRRTRDAYSEEPAIAAGLLHMSVTNMVSSRSKGRALLSSAALLLAGCAGDAAVDNTLAVDGIDGAAGGGGAGRAAGSTGGRRSGSVAIGGAAGNARGSSGGAHDGGATGVGGSATTGGTGSGGIASSGGTATSGGSLGSGGAVASGGAATSGGSLGSGGVVAPGGTTSAGGTSGSDAGIADAAPLDSSSDGPAVHDATTDGMNICEGGAPLPFGAGKKRLFETRARFDGNLVAAANAMGASVTTGLAAGDELCNRTASAAGLGGTWVAWLSDSATNAIDRIQDVGPWYRLDGPEVFANKAGLTGNPFVELWVTEACTVSDLAVWTGTLSNGTKATNTCDDWRSSASSFHGLCGLANTTTKQKWSEGTAPLCDTAYNLYCFEQ